MSKIAKRLNLIAIDTNMGMLDYTIRCIFGKEENAHLYIDKFFDNETYNIRVTYGVNRALGVTFHKIGHIPIIWLPKPPKTPKEHATFSHEVIHAINYLFDWAAIPLSKATEEVFAHSVAHIINNVYEELEKRKG